MKGWVTTMETIFLTECHCAILFSMGSDEDSLEV